MSLNLLKQPQVKATQKRERTINSETIKKRDSFNGLDKKGPTNDTEGDYDLLLLILSMFNLFIH